jgi:hypothetical protein
MPIKVLQNGKTIVQQQRATVEYWHIELDQHDIILAEGLPAESYLDTGNRTGFVNGGAFIEAHPDFKPKHWAETCLPLVQDGPEVARTKTLLIERLKALGYVTTSEADLHVIADGKRIEPIELGAMRFAFMLPPACCDIRLMSRTFIPAHTRAASTDTRSLGLCVNRLQINGDDVPSTTKQLLLATGGTTSKGALVSTINAGRVAIRRCRRTQGSSLLISPDQAITGKSRRTTSSLCSARRTKHARIF